jgi:hypothetical protein
MTIMFSCENLPPNKVTNNLISCLEHSIIILTVLGKRKNLHHYNLVYCFRLHILKLRISALTTLALYTLSLVLKR